MNTSTNLEEKAEDVNIKDTADSMNTKDDEDANVDNQEINTQANDVVNDIKDQSSEDRDTPVSEQEISELSKITRKNY